MQATAGKTVHFVKCVTESFEGMTRKKAEKERSAGTWEVSPSRNRKNPACEEHHRQGLLCYTDFFAS